MHVFEKVNEFVFSSYITPRITNAFTFSMEQHNLSQSHLLAIMLKVQNFNRFLSGFPGY